MRCLFCWRLLLSFLLRPIFFSMYAFLSPLAKFFFEKDVFFEDKKKKRSETFQKQQENVSKKGSI